MRPARSCRLSSVLCLEVRWIILGLTATFLGSRRVMGKEQQCVSEVWGEERLAGVPSSQLSRFP